MFRENCMFYIYMKNQILQEKINEQQIDERK